MADSGVVCTTPIEIPLERSIYVGTMLAGILFGLDIFAFFASVYCISDRPSVYRKGQTFYVVYGGILLVLTAIGVAMDALGGQYMWIDNRNYPGGPLGYYNAAEAAWFNVLGQAAASAANILGDGLLLYRCYIIWDSRWYIIALPTLMYLASSAFAIVVVIVWALPDLPIPLPVQNGVPWVSLSVSLNIIVTSMICFRLLRMRALLRTVHGPETSCRMYTNLAAMLVESAAPFTILGIGLLVTLVQDGPLLYAFGYVWNVFSALSPQIIILRVAMGRGFVKETVKDINTTLVTVNEKSRGSRMTIYEIQGSTCGPGTSEAGSGTSVKEHMGTVGNAC